MKTGLKRIEATLHDLGNRDNVTVETGDAPKRPVSFRISVSAKETTTGQAISEDIESSNSTTTEEIDFPKDSTAEQNLFSSHHSVETFPAQENGGKTPSLPKFKTPSFSNHRHGANPA